MDPMRLLLIIGGGYLLWQYYSKSATPTVTGQTTPGTGVPAGAGGSGTNTAGAGGGSMTTNTTTGGTSTVTPQNLTNYQLYMALWNEDPAHVSQLSAPYNSGHDFVYAQAAAGDPDAIQLLNANAVALSVDQWNFYRVMRGFPAVDPSLMPALLGGDGVTRTNISASDYRSRITAAGLSGLGAYFSSGMGAVGEIWG